MRLLVVGFGTVGQGFAEILRDKADLLKANNHFAPIICGVATGSKGIIYHPDGLEIDALLQAIASGTLANYPETAGLRRDFANAESLIREASADVLVEASPTNLNTAQPALAHLKAALETGKHIVTANKGPIALHYPELQALADAKKLQLRFEGTVMAGTPCIALARELLAGCTILEASGIMNGSTNYILTQMEDGASYEEAVRQATELGYLEADPRADVDGWDAASKVLILMATLFNQPTALDQLSVSGISGISADDVRDAAKNGERYRLIARATPNGGSVQAQRLPISNPLASIRGSQNAITIRTDLMGDITLSGAGAGRKETGFALLSDCLAIHRFGN